MSLSELTASDALQRLAAGEFSVRDWVSACLEQIARQEPTIGAWHYFDPDFALRQAEECDRLRKTQSTIASLQGMPIAIKDNVATYDMPTAWGTPIHDGTRLGYDAAVVERLRSLGAIFLGKTVLTEYAIARAGKTRNPHHLEHTPGGSSSGSAAAVASGMVPVAIGTQTLGSILRPAAYCGILGFKPTFGAISRYGVIPISRDLDHVGIFARSVADLTLLYSVLAIPDARDPDCRGDRSSVPQLISHPPKLAFIKTPFWDQVDPEAQTQLLETITSLANAGAAIDEIILPGEFETFPDSANTLVCAGLALHHGTDFDRHPNQLSSTMQGLIQRGRSRSALNYAQARQAAIDYSLFLAQVFSKYAAILTPVTTGTAPHGLENTGSPLFCTLWTLCGLPTISIPIGNAQNGLPLAIQLVGQHTQDQELLTIADWLLHRLNSPVIPIA